MRYQQGLLEGLEYRSYSPVYGLQEVHRTETGDSPAMRYCMMLQVLRFLDVLNVKSLLDVGCAEGFTAAKASEVFGCPVVGLEMGVQACKRATELTGVPVFSGSADSLPFADNSVDVVIMTEVIEHLENPFHALVECWRVAKIAVIVTTQEFLPSSLERWICMATVNQNEDHAERNFSHASDWQLLFGKRVRFQPQGCYPKLLSTPFNANDHAAAAQAIIQIADHPLGLSRYFGMVGIISKTSVAHQLLKANDRRFSDEQILQTLFAPCTKTPVSFPQSTESEPTQTTQNAWAGVFDPLSAFYQKQNFAPNRIHQIEARRRFLKKPRPVGTWANHLAHFLQLSLHTRRQAPNTRTWFFSMKPRVVDILRQTYRAAKAGSRERVKLHVSPKNPRYGEKNLTWKIDARHISGAERFSLMLEKLDGTTNLRDIPHEQPFLFDTVSPKTGFPTPGKYRVWAVAVGRYGKHLGKPSQVEKLEIQE